MKALARKAPGKYYSVIEVNGAYFSQREPYWSSQKEAKAAGERVIAIGAASIPSGLAHFGYEGPFSQP